MIIEELKSKGITSLEKVTDYLSRNNNGFFYLPENLSKLVANLAQKNCKLPLIRTATFSNFFKVIAFNSMGGTAHGIKFQVPFWRYIA